MSVIFTVARRANIIYALSLARAVSVHVTGGAQLADVVIATFGAQAVSVGDAAHAATLVTDG